MKEKDVLRELENPNNKRLLATGKMSRRRGVEVWSYVWEYYVEEGIPAKGTRLRKGTLEIHFNQNGVIVRIHQSASRPIREESQKKISYTFFQKKMNYPYLIVENKREKLLCGYSRICEGMNYVDILKEMGDPDAVLPRELSVGRKAISLPGACLVHYLRTHAAPDKSFYARKEWKIVFDVRASGKIEEIFNMDSDLWPPISY